MIMGTKLKFVLLIAIMTLIPSNICFGQALVKYKIHCTDVNKRSLSTHDVLVEYDEDILTVNVYKNKITLTSEKFGKTIQFNNYCRHTKEKVTLSSKFGNDPGYNDIFFNSREEWISYSRTKKARLLQSLMQVQFSNNNCYYNFNVAYGEIFDKVNNKWVIGHVAGKNYENDKVRNRLRKDLGELCSDFEYELHERLAIGDDYDPWDQ
jgi:hypothetical protein